MVSREQLQIVDTPSGYSIGFDDNIHALELIKLTDESAEGQFRIKLLARAGFEREFYSADIYLKSAEDKSPKVVLGKLQISSLFSPGNKIRSDPDLFSE